MPHTGTTPYKSRPGHKRPKRQDTAAGRASKRRNVGAKTRRGR
ncbi:hypothetical protein LCGC14_1423610 [marine sediment metagenome]|uniref:Uncharacterized protein n=1 Tax=marine sediment metagenome TaxID=412755 RepID=A0A0F9JQG0_9ZZZZ